MRHARVVGFLVILGASGLGAGCKSEPTFVITFAPQDLRASVSDGASGGGAPAQADLTASRLDALPAPTADDAVPAGKTDKDGGACKKDADCIVVKEDCCGCTAGGRQVAIAKAKKKSYEAKLVARCGATTMCPMVMSTHASCRMVAGCVSGKCELVERKEGAK